MMKILIAAALAALVAAPAIAQPSSLYRSRVQVERQVPPQVYGYRGGGGYWGGHYGGGAPGTAGLPLGGGTANSPGGIVGGGAGAYQ